MSDSTCPTCGAPVIDTGPKNGEYGITDPLWNWKFDAERLARQIIGQRVAALNQEQLTQIRIACIDGGTMAQADDWLRTALLRALSEQP